MVATGVGAAMAGMHPIVDLNFIDFAFGAMDEIANQAAKIPFMLGRPVPLVIRATAGIAHGGPQHNNSLESFFMHLPGISLLVPAFPYDVKGLIKTALRTPEPVIFLMHKRLTGTRGPVGGPDELVPFGRANVLHPGTDCTMITYGGAVAKALAAMESLAEDGTSAEVIDLTDSRPPRRGGLCRLGEKDRSCRGSRRSARSLVGRQPRWRRLYKSSPSSTSMPRSGRRRRPNNPDTREHSLAR